MNIKTKFPEHRRQDPTRQAELRVYDELVNSPHPGCALYEVKPISHCPELDFAIWIERVGCFGLEVKGGQYSTDGNLWNLHSVDGTEEMDSPIQETWDAALAIKTALKRALGRRPYVLPVLLFTDMLPDPDIQRAVDDDGRVSVLWGEKDLVNRLIALPETDRVYNPPTAGQIVAEVAALRPALVFDGADAARRGTGATKHHRSQEEPVSGTERGRMDMTARQVVIHRADVVNVYTVDAAGEAEGQ